MLSTEAREGFGAPPHPCGGRTPTEGPACPETPTVEWEVMGGVGETQKGGAGHICRASMGGGFLRLGRGLGMGRFETEG